MDHIDIGNPSEGGGEKVGARLRDACVTKGYSSDDLAIATSLTEAEVTAVEDGNFTDVHHVEHALR
jgi:hypothetical protein